MRRTFSLIGIVLAIALFALDTPWSRRATAAPDNRSGMALLAAYVSPTGELLDGTGATSAIRTGTGVFKVVFARNVALCAFVPTKSHRTSTFNDGPASATIVFNENNAVAVRVFSADGTLIDHHFQLLVFCNR